MKYIIMVVLIVAFGNLAFAESYLCTSKLQTGFFYNKGTSNWEQASMTGKQFLLKPLEVADKMGEKEYGIYEVQGGTLLFRCQYWFEEPGVAHCGNGNDYHFKFGRGMDRTGRFVAADLGVGFVLNNDKTSQPRISIGTCLRVD